ncbi:MAG: hypothetical protein JNM56_39245, partial [Planctomycetia bacterium]|nr:hypothetical protein [Planctomycetia bacterium]
MQANSMVQAGVGRWKQLLGGLFVCLLLLPVPAYAAIDFSGLSWTMSSDPNGIISGFSSANVDPEIYDSLDTGFLSIGFATQTNAVPSTITFTSSVLSGANGGNVGGNWILLNG